MSRNAEPTQLKQVLVNFGLSQAWAAKQVGITSTYMGMILTGKAVPSAEVKNEILSLRDKLQGAGLRAV